MDESIRPRRPDEKVEETEALLVQRVLVPAPDEIGGLRTQPELDGRCEDSCQEAFTQFGRDNGTVSGTCMGNPRNCNGALSLLGSFVRVQVVSKEEPAKSHSSVPTWEEWSVET